MLRRTTAWGLTILSIGAAGCSSSGARMARTTNDKPAIHASAGMTNSITSSPFTGAKANTGTVTATHDANGRIVLTLSEDFVVPQTPAPHWQVLDAHGNAYLLQRLVIKGDKYNRTITVPAYVQDVARVQIWCAYAETLLGEAPFAAPVN
jgi:hypothetical protein